MLVLALLLLAGIIGIKGWKAWKGHNVWAQTGRVECEQCLQDLAYVPGSKDPLQALDLYLPHRQKSGLLPLIIWIHGGAWLSGDKTYSPAQFLLDRGYAVASLNYRLSDRHSFPAQIYDCKAAVRYLRYLSDKYNLDPQRFGVWGHSAGGHLAALLGTSCDVKEMEGDLGYNNYSSRVQAVADWCGPSDLVTIASQAPPKCKIDFKSPDNPVARLLGSDQSHAAYFAASPVKYVRKDNPPFLILHGQIDDIVPVEQARELYRLLKNAGVPVTCHIAPGDGHGLGKSEFYAEAGDFFDQHLKK